MCEHFTTYKHKSSIRRFVQINQVTYIFPEVALTIQDPFSIARILWLISFTMNEIPSSSSDYAIALSLSVSRIYTPCYWAKMYPIRPYNNEPRSTLSITCDQTLFFPSSLLVCQTKREEGHLIAGYSSNDVLISFNNFILQLVLPVIHELKMAFE